MFYTKYLSYHLFIINIHRNLAKKIKKIYEVNGIVIVSIIDVEDRHLVITFYIMRLKSME